MKDLEKQIRRSKYSKILMIIMWFFMGVLISFMVMWMYATGSKSLTNSLSFGAVSDARYAMQLPVSLGENYINRADYYKDKKIPVEFKGDVASWKYLYIDISEIDVDSIECQLMFINKNWDTIVYEMDTSLKLGMNKIELTGEKFAYMFITVKEPENCKFVINNVQVREKQKIFIEKNDILVAILCFGIYALITLFLCTIISKKHINLFVCIDVLQDILISIGNAFLWIPSKFSYKNRCIFRTILIMIWMAYMMFMADIGLVYNKRYYKYNLVICLGILLLIILSMIERKLKRINWNRQIVFCWGSMIVIMCISEFFYAKRFVAMGYIHLFLFAFLYLVWNNMENQNQFLKDIIHALRALLYCGLTFSILFRPYIEGYGYAGPTWNPNIFAMFLVPVVVADIAEIIELCNSVLEKKKILEVVLYSIEVCVCSAFLILAGSRIGELSLLVSILLFIIYFKKFVLKRGMCLKFFLLIITLVILLVPLKSVLKSAITFIPAKVGHEIEFPADDIKMSEIQKSSTVEASDDKGNFETIMYSPIVTKVLTKRNLYWMSYLRNMNFLGHHYLPKFWGHSRTAHNGILAMSYTYGVLIAIPYLFLYLNAIWISFYNMYKDKKHKGYSFFVFVIYTVTFLFMLVENVERAFLSTEWILFYLLLGALFRSYQNEENYLLK